MGRQAGGLRASAHAQVVCWLGVQAMLQQAGRDDVVVEIVFPVSPEAITTDKQGTSTAQVGAAARSCPAMPGLVFSDVPC